MIKDQVLNYLSRHNQGKTPTDIGLGIGKNYNSASSSVCPSLKSLVNEGLVTKSKINGQLLYKWVDPNYTPPKPKKIKTPSGGLISQESTDKINELIKDGWEFTLHYGDHTMFGVQHIGWEGDFTRSLESGLWDNHECGYGSTPDEAINNTYNNIKNGKRLKHRKDAEETI